MIIQEILQKTVQFFNEKKLYSPRLDAELLLAHALNFDRISLYSKYDQPLNKIEIEKCREVVKRRVKGEPVAYIIGKKWFFQSEFFVDQNVLIPRPETEQIVELAVKYLMTMKLDRPNILDIGAGTGCVGFSILKEMQKINTNGKLVSIEKSVGAMSVLQANLVHLKLNDLNQSVDETVNHALNQTVQLVNADANSFDYVSAGTFDVIVANPPYISKNDRDVSPEVSQFEPHEALYSEQDGLSDLANWSEKSFHSLKSHGLMIFEFGHQQGPQVKLIFERLGFSKVEIIKDFSEHDRLVYAIKK